MLVLAQFLCGRVNVSILTPSLAPALVTVSATRTRLCVRSSAAPRVVRVNFNVVLAPGAVRKERRAITTRLRLPLSFKLSAPLAEIAGQPEARRFAMAKPDA